MVPEPVWRARRPGGRTGSDRCRRRSRHYARGEGIRIQAGVQELSDQSLTCAYCRMSCGLCGTTYRSSAIQRPAEAQSRSRPCAMGRQSMPMTSIQWPRQFWCRYRAPATLELDCADDTRRWGTTFWSIAYASDSSASLSSRTRRAITTATSSPVRSPALAPASRFHCPELVAIEGGEAGGCAAGDGAGRGQLEQCEFEIVAGKAIDFDPGRGTVAGGDAISPWDELAIDGDHIKAEAQAGRMGSQLYAVAVRTAKGRGFRAPTETDLSALDAAERELRGLLPRWLAEDVVPDEAIDSVRTTTAVVASTGSHLARDVLATSAAGTRNICRGVPPPRAGGPCGTGRAAGDAVLTLLALMQGKALNWNALMSSWDTSRDKMRSVFDKHNFAFKWTYAEFEGARELMPWCLDQIVDCLLGDRRAASAFRRGFAIQEC